MKSREDRYRRIKYLYYKKMRRRIVSGTNTTKIISISGNRIKTQSGDYLVPIGTT